MDCETYAYFVEQKKIKDGMKIYETKNKIKDIVQNFVCVCIN